MLATAEGSEGPLRPGGAIQGPLWEEFLDDLAREERDETPSRLGPWRLIEEIGRGGMAVVYLANRDDGHFDQQAAVKLVKRGLDTDEVLRRFTQERQILASLAHANIARLLDGGVAPDGRPWFAMERVEGEPIDQYADSRRLSVTQRLELFLIVARTVAEAHRRLVVHRDLKPSNILVTASGDVRLLDFGIAKLLDSEQDGAAATRTAVRLLTPEYASPEQVRGDAVTTSSDVYQLGLLLYRLLTGRRPYRVTGSSLQAIERAVSEQEPSRPSAAVARSEIEEGEASASDIAAARGTSPDRLRRQLSGDLDAVVLKALRKAPERRHASAAQLADDVEAILGRRPVSARPDSPAYRLRSLVRRHPVAFAAGLVGATLIAAYAATVTLQARQIARERDRARAEALKAQTVRSFLTDLLSAATPGAEPGEVTVREIVDRGADRISRDLAGDPETAASMQATLGRIYSGLGSYDRAAPLLTRSLVQRRTLHSADHPEIAESLHALAVLARHRGEYVRAGALARQALAIRQRVFGEEHEDVAESLDELGSIARQRDDGPEAERLWREALEIRRRRLGPRHPLVGSSLNNVALMRHRARDLDEAQRLYMEALEIQKASLGTDHPAVTSTMHNLAVVRQGRGDLDGAERLYLEVLEIERKIYKGEHPSMANSLGYLGHLRKERGDLAGAEAAHRQALELLRRKLPPGHAHTAGAANNLGAVLVELGRPAAAEPLLREAYKIRVEVLGETAGRTLATRVALGRCLMALGRNSEAESHLLAARRAGKDERRVIRPALEALIDLYRRSGRTEEERRSREALAMLPSPEDRSRGPSG
jgi:serine/threonine-protein kinase